MLACPRCGAAVPESSPQCQYCAAPLLLKACPSCLARVFLGHKFCPECGGGLEVAAGPRKERACPRCAVPLAVRALEELSLDDCNGCGGTFVDRAALEALLTDRRGARAESVLGAYDPGGDAPLPQPPGPMYVKCPDCAALMNRKMFAHGAKVIVDVCRAHGTWFDPHELPRIIRFVMSGGLARAEQAQLAEAKEQVRREMDKLRGMQTHTTPYGGGGSGSVDLGASLLGSFIGSLLR
jgi:Zn-finger nucleic acid-binding protein